MKFKANANLAAAIVNSEPVEPDGQPIPGLINAKSKLAGFDNIAHATTDWHRQHDADNARITAGVVLATGTIKPRLSLLDAVNAKANAWHKHWDATIADYSPAPAAG